MPAAPPVSSSTRAAWQGLTILIIAVTFASSCWRATRPAGRRQSAVRPEALRSPSAPAPIHNGIASEADALEQGPIELDISQAVLLALEQNAELAVRRLVPAIAVTFEDEREARFDSVIGASGTYSRERSQRLSQAGDRESSLSETIAAAVSVSRFLPTGTDVALEARTSETSSSPAGSTLATTRLGLSLTQALLRGYGREVNRAEVRQARLDTLFSQYELRGFAEFLAAEVERTCWDLLLAERQMEIVTESLELARRQLVETRERISIGLLAEIEMAAAEAEVALRYEAVIDAKSTLAAVRLRLISLINPGGPDMWAREIQVADIPVDEPDELDEVAEHVELAVMMRPDLNQARLQMERDELELVTTRNGLLPRLDLFVTLGKTGYASTFRDSVENLSDDSYDLFTGLSLQYPPSNRQARARHDRAILLRARSGEAILNLETLINLDVRTAYIEVERAAEQITATRATRRFQQEALRGETEKFRVGMSTSFLVGQAQRDLVAAQIAEVRALVNYRKALVELYRLEGSLLARRGIAAPGSAPPVMRD